MRLRDISDAGTLATVKRYSTGKAPYLAIPIFYEGIWTRAIFKRAMLQAAIACPGLVRATYDFDTQSLTLNGGRNRWTLKNQYETSWKIRGELEAWARSQRKRTGSLSDRKAAKVEHEIGVLQRKRAKIYAQRPVNPICQAPREYADNWLRDSELKWHNGKQARQALSKVFTVPARTAIRSMSRPDWKTLYPEAAKVLSVDFINDRDKHARITKLTNGPSLIRYIEHPEKYLAQMDKPWRPSDDKWGKESTETLAQTMQRLRMEYLEHVSVLRVLDQQIANLREFQKAIFEAQASSA